MFWLHEYGIALAPVIPDLLSYRPARPTEPTPALDDRRLPCLRTGYAKAMLALGEAYNSEAWQAAHGEVQHADHPQDDLPTWRTADCQRMKSAACSALLDKSVAQ